MMMFMSMIIYIYSSRVDNDITKHPDFSKIIEIVKQYEQRNNTINDNTIKGGYNKTNTDEFIDDEFDVVYDNSIDSNVYNSSIDYNLSLSGGTTADIIEKATTNKLRQDDEKYIESVKLHIKNALNDYIKRINKTSIKDTDITFISQGFNNIIVRVGSYGLLRIRKFILQHMFTHDRILTQQLQYYARNNKLNVLVPSKYSYNSSTPSKWFIYWDIEELKPIEKYDYDKFKNCMYTIAEFINRPNNTFTYVDFKYENFMLNSNDEYILADFDFVMAGDIRTKLAKIKAKPVNDEMIKDYIGKRVKYYKDYNIIELLFAASYFETKRVNSKTNKTKNDENDTNNIYIENNTKTKEIEVIDYENGLDISKYDPKILVCALAIRMFMLHMKYDIEHNEINDDFMITDEVIKIMQNMKSTKTDDIFDFEYD